MFDFEKLDVYQKAKVFNKITYNYLIKNFSKKYIASLESLSKSYSFENPSEASSRYGKPDRRFFS